MNTNLNLSQKLDAVHTTAVDIRMVSLSWAFLDANGTRIGGRGPSPDWCLIKTGCDMVLSGGGQLPPVSQKDRGGIRISATATLVALEETVLDPVPMPSEKSALAVFRRTTTSRFVGPEVGLKIFRPTVKKNETPYFFLEATLSNATDSHVGPVQLRKRLLKPDGSEVWDTEWGFAQHLLPKGYLSHSERETAESKAQLEGAAVGCVLQVFTRWRRSRAVAAGSRARAVRSNRSANRRSPAAGRG